MFQESKTLEQSPQHNMRLYKIEEHANLVKDMDSKAVLNTNVAALMEYKKKQEMQKDIDSLNILRATMKAMHFALDNAIRPLSDKKHLKSPILHLMVDGPHFKPYIPPGEEEEWTVKKECIVDGDATYLSIAGASIVAKYTRDMYMQQLVKEHPMLEIYGISKNKGYGTQQHMTALKEQGRTQFHRVSFRPVKEAPIHPSLQNVLS